MSLFNRPAWAKAHTTEDNETGPRNIFSHSASFKDIVADDQRRQKEEAERKKAKEERKKAKAERRSSGKRKSDGDDDGRDLKKRRFTMEEDGRELLDSTGLFTDLTADTDSGEDLELQAGPVRRSPRKNKQNRKGTSGSPTKQRNVGARVVEIDDGSDGDGAIIERAMTQVQANEEDEEDEDEEFAELQRRARLERRQKEEDEPVIQLFIDSPIPDTNPLLVHRKLSQSLEVVLNAWCGKQNFSREFASQLFFIHRLRRLYSVTTCRRLGFEVNAFGELTLKGEECKEGVEKVHLQAVTQEIHDEMLAARDLESKRRSGELAEEQAGAGAEDEDVPKGEQIRLTLKAKDQPDFKLKVKPVRCRRLRTNNSKTTDSIPDHHVLKDRRRFPQESTG